MDNQKLSNNEIYYSEDICVHGIEYLKIFIIDSSNSFKNEENLIHDRYEIEDYLDEDNYL